MKKSLLGCLFLLLVLTVSAQNKYSLSGYFKDKFTGEDLIGATIYVKSLKTGATTNVYGFYSISLPQGEYEVSGSYIGYELLMKKIKVDKDKTINFNLNPTAQNLEEVVITSEADDANFRNSEMGIATLKPSEISSLPVLFGENDIMKTMQLKAGVKSGGEGKSGFSVRGGSSDQNLILLDESPVYNASHLMGFFSVFNSDAIKEATLIKGSSPANYGGRLSSVMDIQMKEGNLYSYHGEGGIGSILSRFTFEGPIKKGQGSFIVSGRRSYMDLFMKLSDNSKEANSEIYFYDFNMKANYAINKNNRIFVSGYFGRDIFSYNNDDFYFFWGNKTTTLRWNHIFNPKLFLNSTIMYSKFNYSLGFDMKTISSDVTSSIEDLAIKEQFEYYASPLHKLSFGLSAIRHHFNPGKIKFGINGENFERQQEVKNSIEGALYFSDEWKVNEKLTLYPGIRLSYFTSIGPGTLYTYNEDNEIEAEEHLKKGDNADTYYGLEPRFLVNYQLTENSSLKTSYTRNYQYLHLIAQSTTSTPMDIWYPSTNNIKPQYSDQYALGYFRNFMDNKLELSVEVYYKDMYNPLVLENGGSIFTENVEAWLTQGKGRSYGLELSLRKKKGKFTGWISYTLSRTEMKFDDIDKGAWFPSRYDRTHDISIVATYDLNKRWTFSGNWVYYTGDAVTFPEGKYMIDGNIANYYTSRNGYRMPDYHRLDFGAIYNLGINKKRKYKSFYKFSLYNVYGRRNAYSISFRESKANVGEMEAVRLSLFSFVPSLSYTIKF
ncbi:MAG: TonB-dependent receptor domain-containing protein [Hyphomicrobiales bacterium]